MLELTRRQVVTAAGGGLTLAALGALVWPSGPSRDGLFAASDGWVVPTDPAVAEAERARGRAGRRTVEATLQARTTTLDLGGVHVATWAYGDAVPGPTIRARAGDQVTVRVTNALPTSTSTHWHGIRLRNDMDGVPGLTQAPIGVGETFTYTFVAPDPGTYWYHPHSGIQVDRALYGAMIVDDPDEPGAYDEEWVVVVDDWVDGTGRTPDEILATFRASGADAMPGMGHDAATSATGPAPSSPPASSTSALAPSSAAVSDALGIGGGSIMYPHYLVNGRIPTAPVGFTGKPGQRVRLRLVNAGSDTAFRVALGGHRMTVTHVDGFPVVPAVADAVVLGMGERIDVRVTLADGVFPLAVLPEGKPGSARAIVRTGAGSVPDVAARPAELGGRVLLSAAFAPAESSRLPRRPPDRLHRIVLEGSMRPYYWTINGRTHPNVEPFEVREGERVRVRVMNRSRMFHPWHVHGHTFAMAQNGLRRDTVLIPPMRVVNYEFQADNPGLWMAHCHNLYHAEAGMMGTLAYRN